MKLNCESGAAIRMYETLVSEGVDLAIVDTAPGDDSLSCDEVIEYVFNNYERYKELIKETSGSYPSWIIEDEGSVKKFRDARSVIEAELQRHGLLPESKEYKRKLAIGLAYHAYAPKVGTKIVPWMLNIGADLASMGLLDYARWIFANGGLNVSMFQGDAPVEATADGAIEIGKGICTERSKILFASLKDAGFDPFMALVTGEDVEKAWNEHWHGKIPITENIARVQSMWHVFIGVPMGDEVVYLDLTTDGAIGLVDPPYSSFARRLTLREFRMLENSNIMDDLYDSIKFQSAAQLFNLGGQMIFYDPTQQTRSEIRALFEKSIQLGSFPNQLSVGCAIFVNAANAEIDPEEALKVLEMSAQLCSSNMHYIYSNAELKNRLGRITEDDVAVLKDALGRNPDNYYLNVILGKIYFDSGEKELSLGHLLKAYSLDKAAVPMIPGMIAKIYAERGDHARAEMYFENSLAKLPHDREILYLLAATLLEQGKTDEALDVFFRILLLGQMNDDLAERMFGAVSKDWSPEKGSLLKELVYHFDAVDTAGRIKHLVDFLESSGHPEMAEELCKSAGDTDALMDFYRKRNENKKAAELMAIKLEESPDDMELRYELAGIYLGSGEFAKAAENYKVLVDYFLDRRMILLQVGLEYLSSILKSGSTEIGGALDYLDQFVQVDLNYSEINEMPQIDMLLAIYDEHRNVFERDREYKDVMMRLAEFAGDVASKAGLLEQAEKAYEFVKKERGKE